RGLVYPDVLQAFGISHAGHHPFAHALAEVEQHGAQIDAFIGQIRSEVRDGETVLISSEALYRHGRPEGEGADYWQQRRAYLELVRQTLQDFDVRALACFRRRDAFAESTYYQVVSNGFAGSFLDLLERRLPRFEYERQL